MPTYEYRCAEGHAFEQFQKMSDPPVEVCPQCGAAAEKLMSAGAGLVFKGSGFYITDYRSDGYKKAAESDSSGTAGPADAGAKKATPEGGGKPEKSAPKSDTGTSAGGGSAATGGGASGSGTSSGGATGSSSGPSSSGGSSGPSSTPDPA